MLLPTRKIAVIGFVVLLNCVSCFGQPERTRDNFDSKFATSNDKGSVMRTKENPATLRLAIVGLVHTHVHWLLGRKPDDKIEIVGIVEPNRELAKRYARQHGFSMESVYDSMPELLKHVQPEAMAAFGTIKDHLPIVEFCAPRGIHVMVEKPLAINLDHARKMRDLAMKHNIHLLTNYETSWYPSIHHAYRTVADFNSDQKIGKLSFYTGHPGPIEIGCNQEFVEWLIDPEFNGGGALMDFGCYGANLATWFFNGEHPESVTCVTRQIKPDLYPLVDDDATIILNYADKQVLIEASWDWPFHRKEMEVFADDVYLKCVNHNEVIVRPANGQQPKQITIASMTDGRPTDPFELFQRIVHSDYSLAKYDVSSLENNFIVMQILDHAQRAANERRTLSWSEKMADGR